MVRAWRRSLRGRLMVGVILLAALGMVVVNVASLAGLRIYLTNVADANLAQTRDTMQRRVQTQDTPVIQTNLDSLVPADVYIALLDDHGRVVTQSQPRGLNGHPMPRPDLPAPLPPGFAGNPVSVAAHGAPASRYRVLVFPVDPHATVRLGAGAPPVPFGAVVVAVNLRPTDQVLYWLIGADAVATLAALTAIGLLSRGVLRVGMRPLRDMASTASAIAEGDLDQRVDLPPHHSEIGEVAGALNRAFDARQRSEQRLRQFVADASHELRTPLSTIRGWAQLHLHGLARDPELVERAMLRIEHEAARMHAMVEELLLLARLDQGRPLAAEPVELGALATDAVADAHDLDPGRPITIAVHGAAIARGDEDRLLRVVRNLLSNALRHTPAGSPVSVAVRSLPGGDVELAVTDHGPGMDADTAGKVFERFYRGEDSRSPSTGGTGLGLAIVKSITEAHGGTVTLRTAPGKGSRFTITLPGH